MPTLPPPNGPAAGTEPASASAHEAARYRALDGLRAVAILLVLSSHLRHVPGYPALPSWYWHLGDLGNLGVRVFFVLSGFIITHLLVREASRSGKPSLRDFYVRRAFRILPPLVAFLLTMVALRALGLAEFPTSQWVRALVFLGNTGGEGSWSLGHLWSLAVEEQFYLIWPVIFGAFGGRAAVGTAMIALVAGPAARLLLTPTTPDPVGILQNVDGLAAGCLAALGLQHRIGGMWRGFAARIPAWTLIGVVFACNLAAIPLALRLGLTLPLAHAGVATLILKCLDQGERDRTVRLLATPGLVWVGTLSYSLYLWQQPFTGETPLALRLGFPLGPLIAVAIAMASMYWLERPSLRWRRHLLRRASQIS